jgi:hypothetical protein
MGNWENALEAAEDVLEEDKHNIKATYVKAESLFNICEFEHSLVLFHRGLVSVLVYLNECIFISRIMLLLCLNCYHSVHNVIIW